MAIALITNRSLLGHVRWAALGTWGGKLMSLIVFVLLTRLLPVEAIGAISLIAAYLALLQLLAEAGLSEYLVQHQERSELQEQSLFWVQLSSALIVACVFWLAAPLAAAALPSSVPGEDLVRWMALCLPLVAAARVPEAILRKGLAFKQLAMRHLFAASCGGIAGVACAFADFGVWALVVKQLVENVVALMAVMWAARWRPKPMFSAEALRAPLRYGLAVFGARAIGVVHGRLDLLVVGWILGAGPLGYYSVAMRVYQIVSEMFNSVVDAVSVPLLAKVKHDAAELSRMYTRLVRGGSLLSMTAYASLCAIAPLFVDVVFGSQWKSAGPVLQVLALGGVVVGPLWFHGGLLLATGRATQWMMLLATYVVVGAIIFPIGALLGGIQWVALAMVLRSLLLAPVMSRVALKAAGVAVAAYCRAWMPSALIAMLVGAAVWSASSLSLEHPLSSVARLAIGAAAGGVVFLVVVRLGLPALWQQLLEMRRRPA